MLSIPAVLRKAHPLNRKLDLQFKTLCPPADLTFSIDSSEKEVKNHQKVRTFNYNALDETSEIPGVKISLTAFISATLPVQTEGGKKKREEIKKKNPKQKKQINKQINFSVKGDGEISKKETSEN